MKPIDLIGSQPGRAERTRERAPRSVPWPLADETDVVAVDTTWGELQPLEVAPAARLALPTQDT